ncbi:MAG TPA: hypothetical protein VI759_01205 [Dehalococcoidia bacterium]|nr:hypothetical protein [Dehalococcoidia bacterium]
MASFLRVLERGVYQNPRSPYRRLLEHAGIDLAEIERMVNAEGIEGTLERLYDAGVYVTQAELKGRLPIRRPGLEFDVSESDFDNPLVVAAYEAETSGSTGTPSRVLLGLELTAYEAAYSKLLLATGGFREGETALWRPVPPDASGLFGILLFSKIGHTPSRWFSQAPLRWDLRGLQQTLRTALVLFAGSLAGERLPWPRFVPRDKPIVIARWLAEQKLRGNPGFLDTSSSAAVRVCLAARENGLDISGSVIAASGEPYTEGKDAVLRMVGVVPVVHYNMAQIGKLGLPCANPIALDDLHLVTDKVAAIQRDLSVGEGDATVGALYYTTLLPHCPRLMINAEIGDYARLEQRDCGCHLASLGLQTHLVGVRGYDKLTSEGVTFFGNDLFRLVEEDLPARFGGHATDYQLAEQEVDGLTRIEIIVSPAVDDVDEQAVLEYVLKGLANVGVSGSPMAEQWRQAGTMRVVRREPHASGNRKILPLHFLEAVQRGDERSRRAP